MKILIVGSGAREHAIGCSVIKNPLVEEVYFAPGNGGTELIGKNVDIKAIEIDALRQFAIDNKIDYTIVGPEDPLCLGIVDEFEKCNLKIFGPTKKAAMLEGSKAFSKNFMEKYAIPTSEYWKTTNAADAFEKAEKLIQKDGKAVLKADGLCQGKGVMITDSSEEARKFIGQVFEQQNFGKTDLVVEEFVDGFEMSLLCFVDNKKYSILPSAKDYKCIFPHDVGPNTGGMGTYSPNFQADRFIASIKNEVLDPFMNGINSESLDFRGLLFVGLMIGSSGVKVLEFNTRFGDPETQSILQLLETDLLDIMLATTESRLDEIELKIKDKKAVTVVLASGGYPGKYITGHKIDGIENSSSMVFHGGTKRIGNEFFTAGGRVLSITEVGDTYEEANNRIEETIKTIHFEDMYYREDIAPLVKRIYVQKRPEFDVRSKDILSSINQDLGMNVKEIKSYIRYDIQGLTEQELAKAIETVLSEPPVDCVYNGEDALVLEKGFINPIVVQYHKGQFDQREQGVIDTVAAAFEKKVSVNCSMVYEFNSLIKIEELEQIKRVLINPVDQEEGQLLGVPSRIDYQFKIDRENRRVDGFINYDKQQLENFLNDWSLSMNYDDLFLVQRYFVEKSRNPTETEIRMLDTYWSDHCRHTTFNTELQEIEFSHSNRALDKKTKETFAQYIADREAINTNKPLTMMDMATIVAKKMGRNGELNNLEISDENNACSIEVEVEIETYEGQLSKVPYLIMFKNETHNHPTEIEPFGGASTCIGGAIRDPLSGRAFVYQAMRVTGSADPRVGMSPMIQGKLSQRKITTEAARGYSSYGNQIGLATGFVDELYHPGYQAKRMEVGAVIAAAPKSNVQRLTPKVGDAILLIGGRTGRDGIGGATGSSKSHDEKSIVRSSAEVQKGNAPMERRLQRLFRNPEATKCIKKCNDFGAGGVSVAIGELADSLDIWLDKIPLKYQGLSPMEIALSESQERMAVVVDSKDVGKFLLLCDSENLEATHVSNVTDSGKLIMKYLDEIIVELDRAFIDSSGAKRVQKVVVPQSRDLVINKREDIAHIYEHMKNIHVGSKKNLIEQFDSSIGGYTVVAPLGGKNQITPSQAMVAEIPTFLGRSKTVTAMSYGFDPYLSEQSPYLGAYYAVVESLARIGASGINPFSARLSFQEYFDKLGDDPSKWANPFMSMLGAYEVTSKLKTPPIGGKDSMSGSYKELSVPPTLISFAVAVGDRENICTSELKGDGHLYLLTSFTKEDGTLDLDEFKRNTEQIVNAAKNNQLLSCASINSKGLLATLLEMSFGNDISLEANLQNVDLYNPLYGAYIVESADELTIGKSIGQTKKDEKQNIVINGTELNYQELKQGYLKVFDGVFAKEETKVIENRLINQGNLTSMAKFKTNAHLLPKVVIPVFPGTNCEWDMERAFINAGAKTEIVVFNNLELANIEKSVIRLSESIKKANILALPGGFSLGDEPDGSGKFIANLLRNPKVVEAINHMLSENDGLIIGICNGFQALIKTGLLPLGSIQKMEKYSPTLTYNNSGRHIARLVSTKGHKSSSPWLAYVDENQEYKVPISHGEGRFVCDDETYSILKQNNQIAFTYVDNPNGSAFNIEGIVSPCGRIIGKMGHSERVIEGLYTNIPGIVDAKIIQAGVDYYKK